MNAKSSTITMKASSSSDISRSEKQSQTQTSNNKRLWKTDESCPYIGKEIRRILPAQFTEEKQPTFITGKITSYLPSSTMHPRQPTLYHVEYYIPIYPNEDITIEEVEVGLSLTNKRIPLNAISSEERVKEENKLNYFNAKKELNIKNDCLSYMKDVLLERICNSCVLQNLEDNVMREREIKAELALLKKQSNAMNAASNENKQELIKLSKGLPDYYHSYPKKKVINSSQSASITPKTIEGNKLPPSWFSLYQIHLNINSSLEQLYSNIDNKSNAPQSTDNNIATRRSIRKAVQAIEEKEEEKEQQPKLPTNHVHLLLSQYKHVVEYCAKEKYMPAFQDILSIYRSTILLPTAIKPTVKVNAPIICKQIELLNRKVFKDEEAFCKQIHFRKRKIVKDITQHNDGVSEEEKEAKRIKLEKEMLIEKLHWEYCTWRYDCIHFGYTLWDVAPSLPIELQNTVVLKAITGGNGNDQDNNDTLEQTTTLSRRTKKSIFYGGSSGKYISQSQIIDTIYRLVSKVSDAQSENDDRMTYTYLESIVCGTEEAVAIENITSTRKKIPMAFWKLLYLTGKIRRYPIQIFQKQDVLCYKYQRKEELNTYINNLQLVECTIRKLVLQCLSFDIYDISCAADYGVIPDDEIRITTITATTTEDGQLKWKEHHDIYKDQLILRPNSDKNSKTLLLWKVIEYLPSVIVQNDITRRKWFKIVSVNTNDDEEQAHEEETMVITENQLCAGKEAYELSLVYPNNSTNNTNISMTRNRNKEEEEQKYQQYSWIVNEGITIKSTTRSNDNHDDSIDFATVVGYHPIPNNNDCIRILVLMDENTDYCRWETLHLETMSIQHEQDTSNLDDTINNNSKIFFHNPKYSNNAQITLLSKLKNHPKISPFLYPVDPIELELPDYFDVIKKPMDITTLETNCLKFEFSNSDDVANEDFQNDLALIFDNALLYNPSSSWICRDARILKRFVEKETAVIIAGNIDDDDEVINNVTNPYTKRYTTKSAESDKKSKYYVPDSDTSDSAFSDTDYKSRGSNKKRKKTKGRKKKGGDDYDDKNNGESNNATATNMIKITNNVIESYKTLPTYTNLSFLKKLSINTNASSFILEEEWNCKYIKKENDDDDDDDDDDEHMEMEYHHDKIEEQLTLLYNNDSKGTTLPTNRDQIENIIEKLHEEYYSKLFYDFYTKSEEVDEEDEEHNDNATNGKYHNAIFPPYLGHINSNTQTWEIRTPYLIPAIHYIIRGLVSSGHLSYDTLMSTIGTNTTIGQELINNSANAISSNSSSIICNHIYYYNPTTMEPFDVVSATAKKAESEEEESEDEVEINEYERLRRERVARNQERLKALGLT